MKQTELTNEEIGSLCMALSLLLHAGISTGDAFSLLSEDEADPANRRLLSELARRADEGTPLFRLFRDSGRFPAYVCALLEVGERVGKCEETLTALAAYYDGRARMERQLRAALLYPAVLLAVVLAVAVILLVWVLPVFNDVYAHLGSRLTGVAGGLLAFGQALRAALPVLCAVLAVLAAAAVWIALRPRLRLSLRRAWQKRWGDRGVFGKINDARFIQALSLASSSGMNAQEAVSMAAALAQGAPAFQCRCDLCLSRLEAGDSLPQALRASGLLDNARCRLLEAGDRGGQGDAVLSDISLRLLSDSEEALERAAGRIEPTLVAVACLLVGAILLSVMLPLMHIMTAIG
jgi:type IV pilus assembly protein PilC